MVSRRTILSLTAVIMACAGPAVAQEKLGDLVSTYGYEWLIGKWAATTDEGDKITMEYKWGLDRHVMFADFTMRDFRQYGMIVYVPSREEVIQVAADNKGGTWKGTWSEDYAGAVHRMEWTRADGETTKAEIVHAKVDADTMKATMYGIGADGYRASDPWATLTYKRQPAKAAGDSSPGQQGDVATDYQKLADLVSQAGYDKVIGKWTASDDQGRKSELEYKWVLDKHAMLVDVQLGDFKYSGMIVYVPSRQEVIQTGADNMGGMWKGTWDEDYDGVVNRHDYLKPDGTTDKIEHVYIKVDENAFKIKQYAVESGGWRASEPSGELTFKRR